MSEHQYLPWWSTSLGSEEPAAIAEAIAKGNLSDGPVTEAFERDIAEAVGARYAIAVPSGSAALLMSMIALRIGPGDEVIVPNCTWIATAHAASLLGAKVVLADTRPDRPVIDPADVKAKITSRTKAILPVHLGGRAADMPAILEIARKHQIHVVEDACQALLSRTPDGFLGALGSIGCYSLGVAKLLTTGQGGVAVTSSPELYQILREVKFHGVVPSPEGWEAYKLPGFNFKFSDMLAAVGREQVRKAAQRSAHVIAVYRAYEAGLADHPFIRVSPMSIDTGELPLWTEVETPHAAELADYLKSHSIQTRRVHPPLHRAPHLGNSGCFPNAERLCHETLVLPSGPSQPLANVDRVLAALREFAPR